MDPKEIRQRLNLPEDATDEQVQEEIRKYNEAVGLKLVDDAPETPPAGEEGQQPTAPEATPPAVETPQPVAVTASHTAGQDDDVVTIDKGTLASLRAGAEAGLRVEENSRKRDREALVAAAIEDGRIPPARKDHWLKALEDDFEGYSQSLAGLSPGLLPVTERGSNQPAESMASEAEAVRGWTDHLFPDVAARRAQEEAVRGDRTKAPLIQREEGFGA